jgi:two-component sensor histidine kinase
VKNTLAMISAVANQTLGKAAGPDALREFSQRLSAFGAAHDALTATRQPTAAVADVVHAALRPHCDAGRCAVSGPAVTIGSKQALSLAMAMHELATNAVKYGALSVSSGRIDIAWRLAGPPDGEIFYLEWQERGGPPVTSPQRRGFGSRLIESVLPAEFGGTVEVRYAPTGLAVRLETAAGNLVTEAA